MVLPQEGSPARTAFWLAIAALSAVLVFLLPLWVAHPARGFYSAYTVGFNNRLATLAVVALSLTATALLAQRGQSIGRPSVAGDPLPFVVLLSACAIATGYTVLFGWLMLHSGILSPDADYFLSRLAEVRYVHGRIYRDAEFAYGPLLFLLVRGAEHLSGLGERQPLVGYLLADLAGQLSGVTVLFLLIRGTRVRRGFGVAAMALMLAVTLRPGMGLNYTMLRFGTPLLLALWAGRLRVTWRRAVLFGLGQGICLGISPEVGFAFFAGCVGISLMYVVQEGGWESLPLLGCLAVAVVFLSLADARYLYGVRHFANGMLNLVVAPVPNVLVLLIATIGLAPLAVARRLRGAVDMAASFAGMYVVSLAMLSAALGLCDELHTSFNGVGVFLLSLLAAGDAFDGRRWPWPQAWVAILGLCVGAPPVLDSIQVAAMERKVVVEPDTAETRVATLLGQLPAGETVYAPAGVPVALRDALMSTGHWAPSYFDGVDNAFDREADEVKVAEAKRADFVVLPEATPTGVGPDNRRRSRLLRFGYVYRETRVPYQPLSEVRSEVNSDFVCSTKLELAGQKGCLWGRKAGK